MSSRHSRWRRVRGRIVRSPFFDLFLDGANTDSLPVSRIEAELEGEVFFVLVWSGDPNLCPEDIAAFTVSQGEKLILKIAPEYRRRTDRGKGLGREKSEAKTGQNPLRRG